MKEIEREIVANEYDRMYYSGIPDNRDNEHKDLTNYKAWCKYNE